MQPSGHPPLVPLASLQFVTESMLQRLTGEISRRGRAVRVEWRMVSEPEPRDIKLVAGSVVHNPLKQGRLHFVQWTAQISSRQVVAVYDARGNLIAGESRQIVLYHRGLGDGKRTE